MSFLRFFAGLQKGRTAQAARQHLKAEAWPDAIYVIGDIHGCNAELKELLKIIFEHGQQFPGEKWLVYLGDYVDRGPDTIHVLDTLAAPPPPGWQSTALAGNHEVLMLSFLDRPARDHEWLRFGGVETLLSYGINPHELVRLPERQRQLSLSAHIPDEHIALLRELPLTLSLPGAVFVHAGLRPGVPVEEQSENDLLWIRDAFFDAPARPDLLVVHGHTPGHEPVVAPGRICVDTGAFATGILTAVCLTQHGQPDFLNATRASKVTLSR